MIDMRKIYNFYPVDFAYSPQALPSGAELYYECLDCAAVVCSLPRIKVACQCGNLQGAAGKLSIKQPERVRVVKGKLK